jgi:hypothetical protein
LANVYKILGQSAPAATTSTTIYTVPSATQAVVSTITIANRDISDSRFRISVRPTAEALANKHYVFYDTFITGNTTTAATIGITLNAGDIIQVYSNTANLSFSIFGSEIS